eukprot:TRINITY_DN15878_c0_g1_i1.p1 TRINITY_DN15878_c0_g1~~TRINITY_DN15878_c0_g1_i1.p1  ORF type:complete len:471 (+),score=80.93 TRINITY_DN15878_c0_g1_i1:209-1621(+)
MTRFTRCGGGIRGSSFLGPVLVMVILYVTFQGAANVFFIESNVSHKLRASKHTQLGQSALAVTEELPTWQPSHPLLRVYMYDLPRKFTYGVIEQYLKSRDMKFEEQGDDSQLHYPGHQHSAEWFLFSDLLTAPSSKLNPVAARVDDPNEADIFYVPFFSSLSLVVNMVLNLKDPTYSDEDMQEQLAAWLEKQPTWQRSRGRNHVIVAQDPNALGKVKDRLKSAVLLVSDFGRLKPEEGSLVKDVILPYSHRITSYEHENSSLTRDTLLFFMGNRYRKEGGKIRDELFPLLETEPDMYIQHGLQSRESRRLAKQGMRTSKFCLHPAGDTPSACRLFDAIVSVCVPVIVSDFIELPFEDQLDYSEFSIFIPTVKALKPGYLAKRLRNVSPQKLARYQERLRMVRRYFEYDVLDGAVNEIWRQVQHKLHFIKHMIHREKRIVPGVSRGQDCSCICSNISTTMDVGHPLLQNMS